MMSGLASGLRSVVWKIAPPTPNAAPTSTPSTARGSLTSITMYDAPGISSPPRIRKKSGMVTVKSPSSTRAAKTPQQHQRQAGHDEPAPAHRPPTRRPDTVRPTSASASRRSRASSTRSQRPHPAAADQHRKTGTPTTAVMIPTCTSVGGSTTRPTVSASDDQRRAVRRAQRQHHRCRRRRGRGRRAGRPGRRTRSARPARSRRRRAGRTARPSTSRSRTTCRPSPRARSSPSASALSSRALAQRQDGADDEERQAGQQHVEAAAADGADLPEPEALHRRPVGEQDPGGPAGAAPRSARPRRSPA